jgi:hypothetical protein
MTGELMSNLIMGYKYLIKDKKYDEYLFAKTAPRVWSSVSLARKYITELCRETCPKQPKNRRHIIEDFEIHEAILVLGLRTFEPRKKKDG